MRSKRKILVVDDEVRNVKLLSAYLKADGLMPIEAFNGPQAIELAMEHNPDVILLDVMMPEMDGFDVTKILKADPDTRHIPIVLVTSLDGSENRVKGLNVGADEFLTKPVNRVELLARVHGLQRMKQLQEELLIRKDIVSGLSKSLLTGSNEESNLLLIEDDELISKQILNVLNIAKFKPTLVTNLKDARKSINLQTPDVILLDRLLPDGEGLTFLSEIKLDEHLCDVPIIIITALDDIEQKISGIEFGADDYLIKPIEHNELVARVKSAIRRSSAIIGLKRDLLQAQKNTVTDPLTGVRNRYYLNADLDYRCAQAKRSPDRGFAIMMIDIDHFKSINDEFGHQIGDQVLADTAERLQQVARTADIVTRYGGEEFCVILPETEMQDALTIAERMRDNVEQYKSENIGDKNITISIGIAVFQVSDDSPDKVVSRADASLYTAKQSGRNKICVSL